MLDGVGTPGTHRGGWHASSRGEGDLPAGGAPAVHVLDLAKRYGRVTALAGLSMTVMPGEVFGFLGPNGAGKTTAVKLLLGLSRPSGGEGWVLGAPLGDREARRRVGYLPELFRYQDWLSAREVLRVHCALAGLPRGRWPGEVDEALHTVGLLERGDDRVGTFSKGMQQRLGLGVALLGGPELVVLDEPTSALDPVGRHDVREIIHGLRRRGVTVFLNSHLLTEVEHVCDRVTIIDRGRVVASGTLAELLGGEGAVRLRLEGLGPAGEALLSRFGVVTRVADPFAGTLAPGSPVLRASEMESWVLLRGVGPAAVPDLVAGLVGLGVRVWSVEPVRHSLEERFLQLLGGAVDAVADDRPAHSA